MLEQIKLWAEIFRQVLPQLPEINVDFYFSTLV